jgi:hypothetical protein
MLSMIAIDNTGDSLCLQVIGYSYQTPAMKIFVFDLDAFLPNRGPTVPTQRKEATHALAHS